MTDDKKERTAKMEFTAAQEFSDWFHARMRFYHSLDLGAMMEIVDKVWVDPGPAETWLKWIDQFDAGVEELTEEKRIKFVREARLQFNKLRNDPPIRTGMYMLVSKKPSKDIRRRFYEDGTSIFTHGYQDGRTIVITGPRGSGKTHVAAYYILPDCIKLGMTVVGNVPMLNEVPGYHYSELMTDTMKIICRERLAGRYTCRLYDEVQLSQKVMRVASHSYQTQADIWALERKFGSITVAILQRESQIPKELREFTDLRLHKPSARDKTLMDIYDRGALEYYKGVRGGQKRATEILDSGTMEVVPEMDTHGFGLFNVDFEYADFYDFMTRELGSREWDGSPISTRQLKLTIEYMERTQKASDPKAPTLTDEQRALAIKEIRKNTGCTLEEAASKLGWKRGKAQYHIRRAEKT